MQVCNGLCNQSKLYHDDRSSHKNAPGAEGVDKIMEILYIDQKFIRYETYEVPLPPPPHPCVSPQLNIFITCTHRTLKYTCLKHTCIHTIFMDT